MTKQQYIYRFFGKTIDECADLCHEHDVRVQKEIIEPLQKENAELRECLKEALEVACDGCRHAVWNNQKFVRCKMHKNWKCPFGTDKWRSALAKASGDTSTESAN